MVAARREQHLSARVDACSYLVPLKVEVCRRARVEARDTITLRSRWPKPLTLSSGAGLHCPRGASGLADAALVVGYADRVRVALT